MNFVFVSDVFVSTLVTSAIMNSVFSKEGIVLGWRYIIRPAGIGVYKFLRGFYTTDIDDNTQAYETLKQMIGDDYMIKEIMDPVVDSNGVLTRYIVIEKNVMVFDDEGVVKIKTATRYTLPETTTTYSPLQLELAKPVYF